MRAVQEGRGDRPEQYVTAVAVVRSVAAYDEQRTARVRGEAQTHRTEHEAGDAPRPRVPTTVRAASALSRVSARAASPTRDGAR